MRDKMPSIKSYERSDFGKRVAKSAYTSLTAS
jgi:hypothetical protein